MPKRKLLALLLLCVINFFHAAPIVFAAYSQAQKITASDGDASDTFGTGVGIDGSYTVFGAYGDNKPAGTLSGSAYVFYNNGLGSGFAQQAKLEASDKAADDRFGYDVAIDDPNLIVGANTADDTGGSDQGVAYAFQRSGTSWTQKAILKASNASTSDYFGYSVAISGNYAIVGAPLADPSGINQAGTAYIFQTTDGGTTWNEMQILAPASAVAIDTFGASVDIDGNYAIVGATQPGTNTGKVTIYFFTGSTWTLQQTISGSDIVSGDSFGASVSINGSYALVGASYKTVSSQTIAGAAYVFIRSGTTWTQQQKIISSTPAFAEKFGGEVDLEGTNAVIGLEGQGDESTNGNVYLFTRVGTTWSQDSMLAASDGASGDMLGTSVAISTDGTIVGTAPGDDISAASSQGSAYFFTDGGGWSQGGGGGVPEFSTYVYLLTLLIAFALIKKQSVHASS